MPFTVAHRGGTKDVDFSYYGRLLRRQRVDLARAPRTLEPDTGRRWLYVWNTREEAQAFARKLRKDTGDKAWQVQSVEGPVSEGPLGPVEIAIGLRSDGWAFEIDPLSKAMLRSLFPDAEGTALVLVRSDGKPNRTGETLHQLVRQVLPILTGLKMAQLEPLGYRVTDPESEKELFLGPPRDTCPGTDGVPAELSASEYQGSNRR